MFKKRENVVEIEEGNLLSPRFDNDGLIPVITMCSKTKDILASENIIFGINNTTFIPGIHIHIYIGWFINPTTNCNNSLAK